MVHFEVLYHEKLIRPPPAGDVFRLSSQSQDKQIHFDTIYLLIFLTSILKHTAMTWKPILQKTDPLAKNLQSVVLGIAKDLSKQKTSDASLASGSAGLAVCYSYLEKSYPDRGFLALAQENLDRSIDSLANEPMAPSFYGGFTGIAFAVQHLQSEISPAISQDDLNEAIDEALVEHLEQFPWENDYDLVSGLVGYGVYALERIQYPNAKACIIRILEHLENTAKPFPEGISWWTHPLLLLEETRKENPEGYYNLGLAHGVPGVIVFLARMCQEKIEETRAKALLEQAVPWLLAQKLPETEPSCFSYQVNAGTPQQSSRLAWCYGDVGIAISLLIAARSLQKDSWQKEALYLLERSTNRSSEHSKIVDAGLCHGSAGLCLLFNRAYQVTKNDRFREKAIYWAEFTLSLRQPEKGIAGFLSWKANENGILTWQKDVGLLEDAPGIALSLLAMISPIEPNWDRFLLISPYDKIK